MVFLLGLRDHSGQFAHLIEHCYQWYAIRYILVAGDTNAHPFHVIALLFVKRSRARPVMTDRLELFTVAVLFKVLTAGKRPFTVKPFYLMF